MQLYCLLQPQNVKLEEKKQSASRNLITLTGQDFTHAFKACIESIEKDPMAKMDQDIIKVCESAKNRNDVDALFFSEMANIVTDSNIS